jgi:pimeloyl-ACP methyl ester carboxylesterase
MTPPDVPRPAGQQELEVVVDRTAGPLAGTLLLPAGPGPWPAVLLLPGSGPLDRDSDARGVPLGITKAVAHALAEAGIASYRYDKRGVGASPGDWRRPGLWELADDARAALRTLAARAEVDPSRVVLLGHSEGAVLAASIAAAGSTSLAGVVLLSVPARAGEDVLVWQAQQVAAGLPAPGRLALRVLRTDLVSIVRKNHARIRATTTDVVRIKGIRTNARWQREFMAHDPRADLSRLVLPVLAVSGSKDVQCPPEDLARVAELVPGPVEAHLLPDLSHLLRHQPAQGSVRLYRQEVRQGVDPRVLRLVVDWTVRTTARRGPATT